MSLINHDQPEIMYWGKEGGAWTDYYTWRGIVCTCGFVNLEPDFAAFGEGLSRVN